MAKTTSFLLLSLFLTAALCDNAEINSPWYNVFIDKDIGVWAASTGTNHPSGSGKDILYGGADAEPYTVYFTVVSNTTGTTYYNAEYMQYSPNRQSSDVIIAKTDEDTSGSTTSYWMDFAPPAGSPDDFSLRVTWSVTGDSFAFAAIQYNTEIKNLGSSSTTFSFRWFMDYQLIGDDGCAFATVNPDSGRYVFAKDYVNPQFEQYLISPNGQPNSFYEAYGPVTGPVHYQVNPTHPSKLQFGSYTENSDRLYNTFLDISQRIVYSDAEADDSVVLLFWSPQTIAAGASWNVRASIASRYVPNDGGVLDCNDHYACTYDHVALQAGEIQQCINIPIDYYCEDHNPCTVDSCDQHNYNETYFDEAAGCQHLPKDCSDGIFCTDDFCDIETGNCYQEAMDCDDQIKCTVDKCDEELGCCVNHPDDSACQDGNQCYTRWCDEFSGCEAEEIECDDQIACTNNFCNNVTGCYFVEDHLQCNDRVNCTRDTCNAALGKCENYADDSLCNDGDPCTDDYCDVVLGCQAVPKSCYGTNGTDGHGDIYGVDCLIHRCIDGFCVALAEDFKCTDKLWCTDERCNPDLGKCESIPNDGNCDDNNYCTHDRCDPIRDCQYEERECDDWVLCTEDKCDKDLQECTFTPNHEFCQDDKSCTEEWCDAEEGCQQIYNNDKCDDSNPCTKDYCWGQRSDAEDGCVHIEKECEDDITCTADSCNTDSGECEHEARQEECDDNVPCTRDTCDKVHLQRCVNTPIDADCTDNNECTVDWCDAAAGCQFDPKDKLCDDGFYCTENWCDGAAGSGCQIKLHDDWCSDQNECTDDKCTEDQGCTFTPNESICQDDHLCTINTCGEHGCEIEFNHSKCDDGVPCTENICTVDGCVYPLRHDWCDDNIGCTLDECSGIVGVDCKHTLRHDKCQVNRNCTIATCDDVWGCMIDESNCPVDEDCEHCMNCKSGLSRLVADDLEDGSGDLIVLTRNYRVEPFAVANATSNLTENFKVKGSGAVVFGDVEHLSADDGLVIGSDSSFRLVPGNFADASKEACNVLSRGLIRITEEKEVDLSGQTTDRTVDRMYICLNDKGTFRWTLLN